MLIPDNIKEFASNGERLLYLKFKHDPTAKKMYILHSVFTSYHLNNVSGELDFLVLYPGHGIFALEVKHGRVARQDGLWIYTDGSGNSYVKDKSPFAQVNATMHSIRKYILNKAKDFKEKEKNNNLIRKISKFIWGSGVVFTGIDEFPDPGPEGEQWQIFTKQDMYFDISEYFKRLSQGFHEKFSKMKWYDPYLSRPTVEDCENIIRIIRGDFNTNYSEINKLLEGERIIEEFTKEQFQLLDITNFNDRCLFEGPAGTGKTLMAVELFRRKLNEGKKIAFFCFNKNLGVYLQQILKKQDKNNNSWIGSFHSFLIREKGNIPSKSDFSENYFSKQLPLEFLMHYENIHDEKKYDIIIVDEAQDLITPLYLEVFDAILRGGLKHGNWIFFGDFSQQSIFLHYSKDEFLSLLRARAEFVTMPPLKINCRNSKRIARQNSLLTGTPFPEFINGGFDGEPVVEIFVEGENYKKEIEEILIKLVNKGIPVEDIAVLSPKRFENTSFCDSKVIANFVKKGLIVSSIQAFKGLEKNVVIITDFDSLNDSESIKLLYIGVSRAKQRLIIILNKNIEEQYFNLIRSNLKKAGVV